MNINNMGRETLGQRIKRFRQERNLSQTNLSKMINVTISWISTIEADKAAPSPELINKMASAFQVPIRELLQNEDEHMELVSRIKLIEVLLETNQPLVAEDMIRDLEGHPEITQKDCILLTVHLAECWYQQQRNNEVLATLEPLIESLEKENHPDVHVLAWIRNKIGNAYTQKQDTVNAYYNYKKALDLTSRFPKFDTLAAYITYNVGLTLRRRGRNTEATDFLERAGRFFEHTQDLKSYAHALFVQGIAYKNMRDFIKAAEFLQQAKELYHAMNHQTLCHSVQVTHASSITSIENPQEALIKLQQSLEFFDSHSDILKKIFVVSKILEILIDIKDMTACLCYIENGLHAVQKSDTQDSHEIADFFKTIARYQFEVMDYDNAINNGLKSAKIYDMIGMSRDQVNSLKIVVESYHQMDDYKNAFHYQTLRNEILESLQKE